MDRAALSECGGGGRSISKIASADRQIDRVCSSHLSQVDGGRAIAGGFFFAADKDKKLLFHDDRNAAIICPSHRLFCSFFILRLAHAPGYFVEGLRPFMGQLRSCTKTPDIITFCNQA